MTDQFVSRILMLLILFSISMTQAVEVHVNQHSIALEENGTLETPFKTIAQASEVLTPGDICVIHEGIYREVLVPVNSGEMGAPITYIAYGQDKVVITSTEAVTNWELHEGTIYKSSNIQMELGDANMIFYGSEAQQLARWPNDTDRNPFTFEALKIKTASGSYSDSFISHDDIPDYWTDGVMFWLGAHGGCAVQRNITGLNSSSKRLSFTPFPSNWPFGTHSPTRYEAGHRGQFYLMNKLEALDAPGEWYWETNSQTLYYMTPGTEEPAIESVEYAARERTIRSYRNHIVFRNLNFFGAPIQLNGNNQTMDRCRLKNGVNTLITDSDSATAGGAAVLVYGSGVRIENCLIEEGSASGINIGMNATDAVIRNCIVRNFDKLGNHCAPIRSSGMRALISHNTFSGSARDCTRVTGENSVFAYNDVSDALLACQDGGLFYVTGQSIPKNIELHHNWFYNAYSPDYTGGKATGIYLDNDSAGYIVHHNVVWNVEWGGLHFNWDALENQIYNNTFWNVGINPNTNENWAVILCWVPELNGVRTNVRNNTLINNLSDVRDWWDSGAGDFRVDETLDNTFINNFQLADNPFVSFEKRMFEPTLNSGIIDQGQILEGINDVFSGNAPDIGAYESGGVRWVPGADWVPSNFNWFSETNENEPNNILFINDFVVAPGGVQFGSVGQGVISLKTPEVGIAEITDAKNISPYSIDFQWTGLNLDDQGEFDDTITFSLVIEGTQNRFQSYSTVQSTTEGWGVEGSSISETEEIRFTIQNLSVSEHTQSEVTFGGFTGVQCKKLLQNDASGEVTLTINNLPLTFTEEDNSTNPRGIGFAWPLTIAQVADLENTGAEFVVSALNFQFKTNPITNKNQSLIEL